MAAATATRTVACRYQTTLPVLAKAMHRAKAKRMAARHHQGTAVATAMATRILDP